MKRGMIKTGKDVSLKRINIVLAVVIAATAIAIEWWPLMEYRQQQQQASVLPDTNEELKRRELLEMPFGDYLRGKKPDEYGVWR